MPLDRDGASKIALSRGLDPTAAVETEHGWFFPPSPGGEMTLGVKGAIVGKSDGAVLDLGSGTSLERDIHFYDKGFRSETYDLVILEVFDLPAAVALMRAIRPMLVEPTYEYGTVWRIPKDLSDEEISDRLSVLPTVFPDMHLNGGRCLEYLEQAEERHVFNYVALRRSSAP